MNHALSATFSVMSHCNDAFSENNIENIKKPIIQETLQGAKQAK